MLGVLKRDQKFFFFACSWKCWKKCLLFLAELSVEEMSGTRHDEVYGFHRHAYHFIVLQFVLFFMLNYQVFALLCVKEAALMDKKCIEMI